SAACRSADINSARIHGHRRREIKPGGAELARPLLTARHVVLTHEHIARARLALARQRDICSAEYGPAGYVEPARIQRQAGNCHQAVSAEPSRPHLVTAAVELAQKCLSG